MESLLPRKLWRVPHPSQDLRPPQASSSCCGSGSQTAVAARAPLPWRATLAQAWRRPGGLDRSRVVVVAWTALGAGVWGVYAGHLPQEAFTV